MSRANFNDVAIDTSGNALADVQVTVIDTATGLNATIYTGMSGGTLKANPFTTAANGLIDFKAEPGAYRLDIHDTTLPARFSDRSLFWEAVPGDDNGIPLDKLDLSGMTGDLTFTTGGNASLKSNVVATGNIQDDAVTGPKLSIGTQTDAVTGGNVALTNVYQNFCACTPVAGGKYLIDAIACVHKTGTLTNLANIYARITVDGASYIEYPEVYVTGNSLMFIKFSTYAVPSTGTDIRLQVKNISSNDAEVVGDLKTSMRIQRVG